MCCTSQIGQCLYTYTAQLYFSDFFRRMKYTVYTWGEIDGPIKDAENKRNLSSERAFRHSVVAIFVLNGMPNHYVSKSVKVHTTFWQLVSWWLHWMTCIADAKKRVPNLNQCRPACMNCRRICKELACQHRPSFVSRQRTPTCSLIKLEKCVLHSSHLAILPLLFRSAQELVKPGLRKFRYWWSTTKCGAI